MVVREAEKAEGEMDLIFRKDILRESLGGGVGNVNVHYYSQVV